MTSDLYLPRHVKRAHGRDRWPPPDVVQLEGGGYLRHRGQWAPLGPIQGKVYDGPQGLYVVVSLDPRGEPWGELLHASLSVPKGYPSWDVIYAVTRAFFGAEVDAMMPIPREEAFIHGVRGQRQVFHVVEMPQAWMQEGPR